MSLGNPFLDIVSIIETSPKTNYPIIHMIVIDKWKDLISKKNRKSKSFSQKRCISCKLFPIPFMKRRPLFIVWRRQKVFRVSRSTFLSASTSDSPHSSTTRHNHKFFSQRPTDEWTDSKCDRSNWSH